MKDYTKEYLNELLRLDISQDDCEKTKKILTEVGDVADTLSNPLVTHEEKRNIINKLFPESIQKFMMNAVREGQIGNMAELLEDYNDQMLTQRNLGMRDKALEWLNTSHPFGAVLPTKTD